MKHRSPKEILEYCKEATESKYDFTWFCAHAKFDLPLLAEFVEWADEFLPIIVWHEPVVVGDVGIYELERTGLSLEAPTLYTLFLKATGREE